MFDEIRIREIGRDAAYTALLTLLLLGAAALQLHPLTRSAAWAWALAGVPFGFAVLSLVGLTPWGARLLPIVKHFIPWVSVAEKLRLTVDRNSKLVAKMENTLLHYRLPPLDERFRARLVSQLAEEEPTESCAHKISKNLKRSHPHLTGDVLLLLHLSRQGEDTELVWKRRRDYLHDLAEILKASDRLPAREYGFPYDEGDNLERLLDALSVFSLEAIREQLKLLHTLWSDARRYTTFLREHGLLAEEPEASAIFDFLSFTPGLPLVKDADGYSTRATLAVLHRLGESSVRRSVTEVPDLLIDAYARVSLAVFSSGLAHERENMNRTACRRLSETPPALPIVMAYLAFQEVLTNEHRLGGREFVTLDYLFAHWIDKVIKERERLGDGFEVEVDILQRALADGAWNDRLPPIIGRTLGHMSKKMDDLRSLVEKKSSTLDSVKRVFRSLKLATIERYLEARKVNVYLLTFDGVRGRLADLIDCLTQPAALAQVGIEAEVNGRPKYLLKEYTAHTRIGIVPEGWTFDDFHRAFQQDFQAIVEKRGLLFPDRGKFELRSIELTLQRFGLQDYYAFDSEFRSRKAVEQIKALFAEYLNLEDKLAVIAYQFREPGGVIRSIMDGPISELIGQEIVLQDPERRLLDRNDEHFKKELFSKMGCRSPQELGRHLVLHPDQCKEARDVLAAQIAGVDPEKIDARRSGKIAAAYIDTLRVVAETQG